MSKRFINLRIEKEQDAYVHTLSKIRQIDNYSAAIRTIIREHKQRVGLDGREE